MTEETLFAEAVNLAPDQRAAFLAQACAGDDALRQRLEVLLAAYDPADSFLENHSPNNGQTGDFKDGASDGAVKAQLKEQPGTRIGPYRLLQQIGEGGMGIVFMAEQEQPIHRRVALKIIKPGMDTAQVVARFEAERQALALMNHHNIAQVLDVGATEFGRPYFVMELINGIPITKYCDQEKLTPRERLELFIPVCQAIQHAHQKGIIHRDLKPSNILVANYDGRPIPKIIDFGVAKAISQRLTERTMFTEFGQVIGTLEYMSPEQAERNALDIDTRSDIYSLGVLLYELLTGSTPLDRKKLRDAGFLEMLRLIREDEPAKPSTRLSQSGDALPSISAQRKMEPAKLSNLLRGELDWIVMKCLEKERSHRYETANGLARDLQRYLADEPVEACPPSARYRLVKLLHRHKGAAIAATLVAISLIMGIIGTTWGWVEAMRASSREVQRAEAERLANQKAQARLTQIEKGNAILGSIFMDINPRLGDRDTEPIHVVLGQRLDRAARELEGDAIGDPLTIARLQHTLARSQMGLGNTPKAVPLLEKARDTFVKELGLRHADTLTCMESLAESWYYIGDINRAIPLYEETLRLRKEALGAEHPDTLSSMGALGDVYRAAGKLDRAVPLLEETLRMRKSLLPPDDVTVVTSLSNLGLAYKAIGKYDRASAVTEEGLAIAKRKLGVDHATTLTLMHNLALNHSANWKLDKAIEVHEEILNIRKAKYGPDSPETLSTMSSLADNHRKAGRAEVAVPIFQDALQRMRAKLPPDHFQLLACMNGLGLALRGTNQNDKALALFEESWRLRKAKLGTDHPDTIVSLGNIATTCQRMGDLPRAIHLLEEVVNLAKTKLGPQHPTTLLNLNNLSNACLQARRLEQALAAAEESLNGYTTLNGPDHQDTLIACTNVAKAYMAIGNPDKAVPLLKRFIAGQHKLQKPTDMAILMEKVAVDLLKARGFAGAGDFLRECLAIRQEKEPDAWPTFNTQSMLGGVLLAQQNFADAEPLLLKGYEGLKKREDAIPKTGGAEMRLPEAIDRLVEFYSATNKPDEMKKWQDERAKYPKAK